MIEKPPNVRFATPGDETALYGMLIEMWEVSDLARHIPYDAIVVMETAEAAVNRKGGWIVGICENEDGPVGTIGLMPDRWWWTRDCYYLLQRWCIVTRRAQGRGYADDLMQFGEWCRQRMADDLAAADDLRPFLIETSYVALDRLEARERIWSRWGRKIGAIFLSGL